MTIKDQAYRAHAFLQERGVTSLKRTHVHALLAAALGYSTYAAFGGPAYVGGDVGTSLDPLPHDADSIARHLAWRLFTRIEAQRN